MTVWRLSDLGQHPERYFSIAGPPFPDILADEGFVGLAGTFPVLVPVSTVQINRWRAAGRDDLAAAAEVTNQLHARYRARIEWLNARIHTDFGSLFSKLSPFNASNGWSLLPHIVLLACLLQNRKTRRDGPPEQQGEFRDWIRQELNRGAH